MTITRIGTCGTCGEDGHYTPTCPKANKLFRSAAATCGTCGKEGHYTPTCPLAVKTRIGICGTCGEEGHYTPTCPLAVKTRVGICGTCGEEGHYTPTCPLAVKTRVGICGTCGEEGHYTPTCPLAVKTRVGICGTCGEEGHYTPTCPKANKLFRSAAATCGTCGKEGHYSPTCPQALKAHEKLADVIAQARLNSDFSCGVCGKSLNSSSALRYHLEEGVCKSPKAGLDHVGLLEALEKTTFGGNNRPGLKADKPKAGRATSSRKDFALTLGVIKAFGRGIRASNATRGHEGLTKNICDTIRRARPDFPFTSVQVNKNSTSKLHVDSGNAGPSLILGLGDYKNGELYVDGRGLLDVQNKWVRFDGNVPHFTNVFTGRRYTLIFFVSQSYKLLPGADRRYLWGMGFNLPTKTMTKPDYGTKQSRIDEARKRVPKELGYAMGPKRTLFKRRRIDLTA